MERDQQARKGALWTSEGCGREELGVDRIKLCDIHVTKFSKNNVNYSKNKSKNLFLRKQNVGLVFSSPIKLLWPLS